MASDFRSDTVTRPSPAMRAAIAAAEVGDDVLDGDPTVRRLERAAAEWLGKEGALFVPSGTMGNQIALGVWTRPGDEVVVQRWAHVTTFEAGAPGFLHGVQTLTVGDLSGRMDAGEVRAAVRPDFVHCPRTALVCFEQTHNVAGGRVASVAELDAVAEAAHAAGARAHLDGARLANAAVASGVPAARHARDYDSVMVCLSKGLGAPVGSVVAGDGEFLERARLVRKRLGGWMRQAGLIAAGGLYALEHNQERLLDDHVLASDLGVRLARLPGLSCDLDAIHTNIVMVRVETPGPTAAELARALAERDVLVMPMGADVLRFVTHLDVGPADLERLERAAREILAG